MRRSRRRPRRRSLRRRRPPIPPARPPQQPRSTRRSGGRWPASWSAAAYAAVGGIIPVPIANVAGATAVIVRMVKVLSGLYGVPFERDRARAVVIGLMGGTVPTGFAAVTTSTLVSLVPVQPHRPCGVVGHGHRLHPQHRAHLRRTLRGWGDVARSPRRRRRSESSVQESASFPSRLQPGTASRTRW